MHVRRAAAVEHAVRDAVEALKDVARGDTVPSEWFANGRDVVEGIKTGGQDGITARVRDRSTRRNPNGRSKRADRAVAVYDWR